MEKTSLPTWLHKASTSGECAEHYKEFEQAKKKTILSKKMRSLIVANLIAAGTSLLPISTFAQATIFKAVPLDGGGWTSGLVQADNGRLYAYGDVFGAWRSDNGGDDWTYLNWNIPEGSIVGYGMAVQRDNADVVYYYSYSSIYKSTDGGGTWTKILSPLGDNNPRFRGTSPLLIRANNANEIWYAGPRKDMVGWLWKSSDGGKTWAKAGGSNFDSNRARTLHNISAFPNEIWVGADNGLYVSTDGGNNFTRVCTHTDVGMIQRFASGPNKGVGLITRSQVNFDGGGITRIEASDYNNFSTYTATPSDRDGLYFGYPTGLQIFSDGTCSAWNTQGNRHGFSTDGGKTFKVRATTLNPNPVPIWTTAAEMTQKNHPDYGTDQVIEDVKNPNKWIITGGGAAMYSLDKGLSWQYFPNGRGIAAVKTYQASVSRHDANKIYIPCSDIGSAIVTDGGASGDAAYSTCKSAKKLHGSFRILEGPNANNLVMAGVNQAEDKNMILKSNDGGATWTEVVPSSLPNTKDGINKAVMSLNSANDYLVVLSEVMAQGQTAPAQRVYRTTDGGNTFSPVIGLPDNMETGGRYFGQNCFIERDATDNNVRYFTARKQGFFKSVDGGSSWSAVTHPFGNAWIWGLVADPIRSNVIWAAGDYAGIKFTTDGGNTWKPCPQFFDARHVGVCDGKIAVWGKKDGGSNPNLLWYSADNGNTWTAQTTPEKNFHGVQGIAVDRNGKIWVSWNSATVVTPSNITGQEAVFENVNQLSVYPNPASEEIFIDNASVGSEISISDISGRVLLNKTVQNSKQGIDISSLSTGIYLVKVGQEMRKISVK